MNTLAKAPHIAKSVKAPDSFPNREVAVRTLQLAKVLSTVCSASLGKAPSKTNPRVHPITHKVNKNIIHFGDIILSPAQLRILFLQL